MCVWKHTHFTLILDANEKAKQNRVELVTRPDRGVGVVEERPDAEGRLEGTGGRCLGHCGAGSCDSCGSLGSCCLSSCGRLEVLLDLSLDLLGRCLTVDAASASVTNSILFCWKITINDQSIKVGLKDLCPYFSVVPKAMHKARLRALEERRVSSKRPSRMLDQGKGVALRKKMRSIFSPKICP